MAAASTVRKTIGRAAPTTSPTGLQTIFERRLPPQRARAQMARAGDQNVIRGRDLRSRPLAARDVTTCYVRGISEPFHDCSLQFQRFRKWRLSSGAGLRYL